jgi:hypothetical protein
MNADARSSGVDALRKFSGEHPATRHSGVVQLAFDKSVSEGVNIYAKRGTASLYVDNRPLLAAGKHELRECKAVHVVGGAEIGLFSGDVWVNCAP